MRQYHNVSLQYHDVKLFLAFLSVWPFGIMSFIVFCLLHSCFFRCKPEGNWSRPRSKMSFAINFDIDFSPKVPLNFALNRNEGCYISPYK